MHKIYDHINNLYNGVRKWAKSRNCSWLITGNVDDMRVYVPTNKTGGGERESEKEKTF